jgi:hypothetical protein
VPLSPLQIPRDLSWALIGAVATGSQRLTAWTVARPASNTNSEFILK